MSAYIIRRILIAIPVLLGITIVAFTALSLAPGDPLLARLDPSILARIQGDPARLAGMRHELGLDQPLPVRYLVWLSGALQGDFGYSIQSHRTVIFEITKRIPPTLALMGTAMVIAITVGIPFGVISALRQYSRLDYTLTSGTMLMASIPTFVLGLGAIYVFAVWLHVVPSNGIQTLGKPSTVQDFLWHLVLPAMVLGLSTAAPLMRYTRASMLDVLNSEYITTAKSKGIAHRFVVIRHAFRNSLIPIITVVGLLIPELVAGAVITEQIFSWPGMGQLAVRAASDRDTALMMGVVIVVGVAVLATNIVVDVLYATVDPEGFDLAAQAEVVELAPHQVVTVEHTSLARAALGRFLRHRLAVVGTIMLLTIVMMAILAPFITNNKPFYTDMTAVGIPPGPGHPLGTDRSGRDVWARLLFGAQTSLIVGLGAVTLYVIIGTVLGGIAGLLGGKADQIIMRATDTLMSIPSLLLVIVFVTAIGPSLASVLAVIGLLGWPGACRLVRGQLLQLRESEFITAARVVGVGNRKILFNHLLPNIMSSLAVLATFGVASAIILEAALSFLGLGVQIPTASWGGMINEAQSPSVLIDLPWLWLSPGVAIALTVLSVNFIGDGLRDALDPKSTRRA